MTHQSLFIGLEEYDCICEKKRLYKAFCFSREGCTKSDKLPQVMTLEAASVGVEDTFENLENLCSVPHMCFK